MGARGNDCTSARLKVSWTCLHSDHGEEIYCGFCNDCVNQHWKLDCAPIKVCIPNNDKECRYFYLWSAPSGFYTKNWRGSDYIPNMVPIEFGTNLNWRSIMSPQNLEASTGIGGNIMITGGLIKDDMTVNTNFTDTSILKYTVSILFPELITYTLDGSHISPSSNVGRYNVPQWDKDVWRKQEKHD